MLKVWVAQLKGRPDKYNEIISRQVITKQYPINLFVVCIIA